MSNFLINILLKCYSCFYGNVGIEDRAFFYRVFFSKYFNFWWYKKRYNCEGMNPYSHYLTVGWKKYYNPSPNFSTIQYLIQNPDVRRAGMNPLEHYIKYGINEPHRVSHKPSLAVGLTHSKLIEIKKLQDQRISRYYDKNATKLIVYLVPDFDQICGGMMCITNYMNDIKNQPEVKGYSLMLATIPSTNTFADYSKFDAHNHIYRFEQIRPYFKKLSKIIINVPEYQVINMMYNMSSDDLAWLSEFKDATINIMNQNQELMPDPVFINMLRKIVPRLTMTCAHEQYCNNNLRCTYSMPLHYIPADKKIKFLHIPFEKKDNLLVLSPDVHYAMDSIVLSIQKKFPEIKIVVVENMEFKEYLKLIAKAKWVLSFGEGFDGYTIESIFSGTISFTLFNHIFFSEKFKPWPNMYENASRMLEKIANDMQTLNNKKAYNGFLARLQTLCNAEFANHKYEEHLKEYYRGEYTMPYDGIEHKRTENLISNPLVSVLVAVGENDKYLLEQLDSIMNQTYKNLEIILCEYVISKKNTEIIEKFLSKNKQTIFLPKQLNHNEAMKQMLFKANGKYVAFCEDKDIWLPQKIEELVKKIDMFDIAFGSSEFIDENGQEIGGCGYIKIPLNNMTRWYQLQDIIIANPIIGSTMMVRREFAIKVFPKDINSIVFLSWWIVLYAIVIGHGALYVGSDVIKYRDTKKNYLKETFLRSDYIDLKWQMIKRFYDQEEMSLTEKEKKILQLHLNWLMLQQIWQKCEISNYENFMMSNHYAFTQDNILKIKMFIQKFSNKIL